MKDPKLKSKIKLLTVFELYTEDFTNRIELTALARKLKGREIHLILLMDITEAEYWDLNNYLCQEIRKVIGPNLHPDCMVRERY